MTGRTSKRPCDATPPGKLFVSCSEGVQRFLYPMIPDAAALLSFTN